MWHSYPISRLSRPQMVKCSRSLSIKSSLPNRKNIDLNNRKSIVNIPPFHTRSQPIRKPVHSIYELSQQKNTYRHALRRQLPRSLDNTSPKDRNRVNTMSRRTAVPDRDQSQENNFDPSILWTGQDEGLKRYIRKTYTKVGLGSFLTLGGLSLAPYIDFFAQHSLAISLGSFIPAIVCIFMVDRNPEVMHDQDGKDDVHSSGSEAAFWGLVGSMTLGLSPYASMVHAISPLILPQAAVVASGVMLGTSLYAYYSKPSHFQAWKGPLYGCLTGLFFMNLVNLMNILLIGSVPMFHLLHNLDVYGGLVLFTAFNAYDTYTMVTDYKEDNLNHIVHAMNFYLNFVNILRRVMNVIHKGKVTEKDD